MNIVECLECNGHYPEYEELIEECPHCGNTDLENTIYLSPDGEFFPVLEREFKKGVAK